MQSERPIGREPITDRQLLRYAAIVTGGVAVVHAYTAFLADSEITVLAALLLLVLAIYAFVFHVRHRPSLRMRAYASLIVHGLTYAVVVGSFWVHAAVLTASGRGEVLAAGWSGPLISMTVLWGVGLVAHAVGALLSRGYDDVGV